MLDMYTEDAVFDLSLVFPDVAPVRGRNEIRDYWATLRETWDGIRVDPLEGYILDDGRWVVEQRMWATGTRSGLEIDQRFAMLYTVRPEDTRIAHAKLFPDVAAAIAAGESEPAGTATPD
jgi:ketosteroid isomerase-like protein